MCSQITLLPARHLKLLIIFLSGRIAELSVLVAGYGKNRLGRRKKMAGKKRSYGVITGLAAKKAVGAHKGVSPLNRQPLSEKVINNLHAILVICVRTG